MLTRPPADTFNTRPSDKPNHTPLARSVYAGHHANLPKINWRGQRDRTAVGPMCQPVLDVVQPHTASAVRRDGFYLTERSRQRNRRRLAVGESEQLPIGRDPDRFLRVGVHRRDPRASGFPLVRSHSTGAELHEAVHGGDPDTGRRDGEASHDAEIDHLADLAWREPIHAFGRAGPHVAVAIFEQRVHAVAEEAGEARRALDGGDALQGVQIVIEVRPPQPLSAGRRPQVATAIAKQAHAAAALRLTVVSRRLPGLSLSTRNPVTESDTQIPPCPSSAIARTTLSEVWMLRNCV